MRMVVVLPLPLGPRKPQIWPRSTWMLTVIDHGALAEALGQILHVDDRRPIDRLLMAAAA